ncbi:MAG: hypothetical protein AAGF24_11820, partial [Cyanobacteria bacterium P01_H01_bin.121]
TATLLTGLHPVVHGAVDFGDKLPEELETLAEVLKESGYRTGAFSANVFASDVYQILQGFESKFTPKGKAPKLIEQALEWLDAGEKDKPFFLYLLPGLTCLVMAYLCQDKLSSYTLLIQNAIKKLWIGALTFAGLTFIYLFQTRTEDGISYFEHLRSQVSDAGTSLAELATFLYGFQNYSHRVYQEGDLNIFNDVPWSDSGLRAFSIALSLSIWCYAATIIWQAIQSKPINIFHPTQTKLVALSALATIAVFISMSNPWAGHHFIYLHATLILLIIQFLDQVSFRRRNQFLTLYIFVSLLLCIQLPFLLPKSHSAWERYPIFDYLKQAEVAGNYTITHVSWGTYYVSALYGHPDQLVTYVDFSNAEMAEHVHTLSKQLNRKVLIVCNACNALELNSLFKGEIKFEPERSLPESSTWRVYRQVTPQ